MAKPNKDNYSGERLRRAREAYGAGQDYAGDLTYRTTRTEQDLRNEAACGCMDMFMGDEFAADWAYAGVCDELAKYFASAENCTVGGNKNGRKNGPGGV